MAHQVLLKQPTESLLFDFDLSLVLRTAETITSVGSLSQTKEGLVVGSTDLTLGAPTYSGQKVQVRISAGTGGERYKITGSAQSSGGDTIEFEGVLWVKDI